MFLAIGFLATWGVYRGGFPFFFLFLMFLFVCMALKGGRGGWHHNRGRGPEQQRQAWPHEVKPYQGNQAQPGAPGTSYQGSYGSYGSYGNEGTPTVRTDMNSGAGTVRVDSAPGSGQPTSPLQEQPRPEEPRARVQNDR